MRKEKYTDRVEVWPCSLVSDYYMLDSTRHLASTVSESSSAFSWLVACRLCEARNGLEGAAVWDCTEALFGSL